MSSKRESEKLQSILVIAMFLLLLLLRVLALLAASSPLGPLSFAVFAMYLIYSKIALFFSIVFFRVATRYPCMLDVLITTVQGLSFPNVVVFSLGDHLCSWTRLKSVSSALFSTLIFLCAVSFPVPPEAPVYEI